MHATAHFVAHGLLILRDVSDDFLTFLTGEDAQIGRTNTQIRADSHACHADHHAVHGACLLLKDCCQLLLQQS